jgi:3'-phosphoadenosine 5'-phosphosulfate sulfotransferase (PAPS reductase)/FAD synthetase
MRKIVYTLGDGRVVVVHPIINTIGEASGFTEAQAEHQPIKTFILSSGGNDSMVLLDYCAQRIPFDAVVHVNTGTGVTEGGVALTTQFLKEFCAEKNYPFIELRPPKTYEEVFLDNPIIDGLPGPGMHHIAYTRLKERPLMAFVKEQKQVWKDRVMFLTGIRADESRIRMGYRSSIVDRRGAVVWVNPIYFWTNEQMQGYRAERQLPQNPVAQHIHMSGKCLCGAFAKPGELEEIRFFFPETAARIESWEKRAKENGLTHCTWGKRRAESEAGESYLCQQCVGQMDMFDTSGVITQAETRELYRRYHEGD